MRVDSSLNFVTLAPFVNFEKTELNSDKDEPRYRLTIEAAALSYSAEYFVAGDKTTFNFSKLPDIVGTGQKYGVQVGDQSKTIQRK